MSPKQVIVALYNILVATSDMDRVHSKVAEAFKRAIRAEYPDVAVQLTDRVYSRFGDNIDVFDLEIEAQVIRDELYENEVAHKVAGALDAVASVRAALRPDDPRDVIFCKLYNMIAMGQHYRMLDDDLRALRDCAAEVGAWCEARLAGPDNNDAGLVEL